MAHNLKSKTLANRRAVAPVIATLLMVAIAVVGGTLIFVFSQGFFSSSQISGTPTIESIEIFGYDARDVANLDAHDQTTLAATAGTPDNAKQVGEDIAVYIKNDSVQQVLISELRIGGTVYNYTATPGTVDPAANGEFSILDAVDSAISEAAPTILPGQSVTVYAALEKQFPVGRDTQFKLTTTNGQVFVGTVVMGQDAG